MTIVLRRPCYRESSFAWIPLAIYLLTQSLAFGQFAAETDNLTIFRGRVAGGSYSTYRGLVVEISQADHTFPTRADVASDGTFTFGEVPMGDYQLRVLTLYGDELGSDSISVNRGTAYYEMRLPEANLAKPASGTVSIQQLTHPPSKQVRKLLASGNKLLEGSHFDDAATRFREAAKDDPDCPEAHAGLGLALAKEGAYPEAAEEYRAAIFLDSKNGILHSNLGGVLAMMKRFGDAETEARTALKLDPLNIRAHMILAAILLQTSDRVEEAMPHLVAAEDRFPSAKSAIDKICAEHRIAGCPQAKSAR